jgi:hypothetical protein
MINESKALGRDNLPILPDEDYSEFNVEGYVQLDSSNLVLNQNGELQTDQIENEEVSETNKEYTYFNKHFYGQVINLKNDIFNVAFQWYYYIKEHFNFIGKIENNNGEKVSFVLSLKYEDSKIRCILR